MKVDKNWGDDSDSGFLAYGTGGRAYGDDPVFPKNLGRNHPRAILCELVPTLDGNTQGGFRKTRRVVGAVTAAAWTTAGFTVVSSARGIPGAIDYQVVAYQSEHVMVAHPITVLPEPNGV
jgi:hypothetical protein